VKRRRNIIMVIVVLVPIVAGICMFQLVRRVRAKATAAWEGVNIATFTPLEERRSLENGAALFGQFCARCHFKVGKGASIGPALDGKKWQDTDDFAGLCRVIAEGRPNTAMIPWKSSLSPKEVAAVASYLWTRPANPE
jgi:mono/diheme cytochrome c family protein